MHPTYYIVGSDLYKEELNTTGQWPWTVCHVSSPFEINLAIELH